jgi:hypothetical protein
LPFEIRLVFISRADADLFVRHQEF